MQGRRHPERRSARTRECTADGEVGTHVRRLPDGAHDGTACLTRARRGGRSAVDIRSSSSEAFERLSWPASTSWCSRPAARRWSTSRRTSTRPNSEAILDLGEPRRVERRGQRPPHRLPLQLRRRHVRRSPPPQGRRTRTSTSPTSTTQTGKVASASTRTYGERVPHRRRSTGLHRGVDSRSPAPPRTSRSSRPSRSSSSSSAVTVVRNPHHGHRTELSAPRASRRPAGEARRRTGEGR